MLAMPSQKRGAILLAVLASLAVLGCILTVYFSNLQGSVRLVTLATGRAQALYLAEAGLDTANDLLAQSWENYRNERVFPMHEVVSAHLGGIELPVGEFVVTIRAIDTNRLGLTSTGRSQLVSVRGSSETHAAIERTFHALIVRKVRPAFQRQGLPGVLAAQADHFDKDGLPDVVHLTGDLDPTQGEIHIGGTLTSGGGDAAQTGHHLLASFTDVDHDGNLDLVVSDAPSRDEKTAGSFIPNLTLPQDEAASRTMSTTLADVFHTGNPIPVTADGWLFLPQDSLSGREPGTDVFLNKPLQDGTLVVSWGEQLPGAQ